MVYGGTWQGKQIVFKTIMKFHDDSKKMKILRQMEYLRQLNHSSRVVKIYGATLDDDNLGIVMEHLSYSLFHALFTERIKLPEAKRRNIIRHISYGLVYLHSKDIVHCHLTAKNIFLTDQNIAKIGNYGPKLVSSSSNYTNDVLGDYDPRYSAPEISHRAPLTFMEFTKADVYSLGMITYVVLSMREPYKGLVSSTLSSTEEELHSTLFQDVKNPRLVLEIVRSCWDMNADKRPTAPEFVKSWRKTVSDVQ